MRLLLGADLVPTQKTEHLFIGQDASALLGGVAPLMKDADFTVINLECALTASEGAIKKFGPNLKAHPSCADALKAFGVTDVCLANNHVFDYGVEGLRDTLDNLSRVGLSYTGVGNDDVTSRKPHILEKDGTRVGIINVCEHEYTYALPNRMGANPFNPFTTLQDVSALKKQVDFVIVLYHGGKEHCRYPSPRLYKLCRAMVDFGADVVITQHSHCIGCYERYKDGHILHGQGNFHFCADGMQEGWYTALLVQLDVNETLQLRFHPIVSKENGIDLADERQAEEIMDAFAMRNEQLKNGQWQDGWRAFCLSVRDFYQKVAYGFTENADERAREFFAHYLDCEAHTDVWRELFPTWNSTNEL